MWGYGWMLVCLIIGAMPAPLRVHAGPLSPSKQSWWVQQTGPYWVKVKCDQSQINVSVEINPGAEGLLVKPSDLTLGDCPYTSLENEKTVFFAVGLQDCGSQVELTPDTMIYRNILFYNPETTAPTSAERGLPSAVLIECHYPRWMPLEGSSDIGEAKDSKRLGKLRPAVGRQKRSVYWQQGSNDDVNPAPAQDTIPEAVEKVRLMKPTLPPMIKDPGMIMTLIIIVGTFALVLFAVITQFVYRRCGEDAS